MCGIGCVLLCCCPAAAATIVRGVLLWYTYKCYKCFGKGLKTRGNLASVSRLSVVLTRYDALFALITVFESANGTGLDLAFNR